MTNDPPGGMPGRRPPTIDVIASEIESWPVTREASQARTAEPAVAADPTPFSEPRAPASEPPASAAEAAPPAAAVPEPPAVATDGGSGTGNPPSEPPARKTPPPRRGGFGLLGVVGAGILGGAVAAALALFLVDRLPLRDNGARGLDARLVRAEQQLRELAARPQLPDPRPQLDELAARLEKLETAPVPAPDPAPIAAPAADPALANRIARLEGEMKALGENVALIGRRSDEAAAQAREARVRADAQAATLAELAQKLAELAQKVPGQPAVSRGDHETLAARVAELAKKPPDGNDRAVRLALAAVMLRDAAERGAPFAGELAAAKALAADPKLLAPLEPFAATGLPGSAALGRELVALAPSLLTAAGATPREGTFLARLQVNAEKLVRVRPTEEVAGDDVAAIVARIEVKAARGDLAGALAELAKLPAPARAPAEPWIKQAEARNAALDAGRRLAAEALGGFGK